ncbi:MAG: hypothetical protein WDN46_19060 [Methylocella sp.]
MSFSDQQTWVGVATGTGNAIALTVPNCTSYADLLGVPLMFPVASDNTTATTINVNSFGNVIVDKVTGSGLAALTGGEFVGGNLAVVVYNGSSFVIASPNPIITPTANTVIGFSTSGTYTPSAGVTRVFVQIWGGGGGGHSVGAGSHQAGDGGGGAEYRRGVFTITPGAGIAVTVGGGGAAGSNGTASSFGSFITANPGHGATGNNSSGPGVGGTGGTGGFGFPGYAGTGGFTTNGNDNIYGIGGSSFGTASASGGGSPTAAPGAFPGGGGSGGNGGGGSAPGGGGPGAGGLVLIQELSN